MLSPEEWYQLNGDPKEPEGADPTENVFELPPAPAEYPDHPANQFEYWYLTIPANSGVEVRATWVPEYFIVAAHANLSGGQVFVYSGTARGGIPIAPLTDKGRMKIPPFQGSIYLYNSTAAPITMTAWAVRNFEVSITYG